MNSKENTFQWRNFPLNEYSSQSLNRMLLIINFQPPFQYLAENHPKTSVINFQ